jgi:hypothetical protein
VSSTTPEQPTPSQVDKEPADLKRELERMDKLKASFDQALVVSEKTGDYDRVFEIKKEIDDGLAAIKARSAAVDAFNKNVPEEQHVPEVWESMFGEARRILGRQAFGPDEIESALHIEIDRKSVPEIPFTTEDLLRAHLNSQVLLLTVGKDASGRSITLQNLEKIHNGVTVRRLIRRTDEFENEDFFTKETPELGWVLAQRNIIGSTKDATLLKQTEILANLVEGKLYGGAANVPTDARAALKHFDNAKRKYGAILPLTPNKYQEVVLGLSNEPLNKYFRPSPVEVVYQILAARNANRELFFRNELVCTNALVGRGRLVAVGETNLATGISIMRLNPLEPEPNAGLAPIIRSKVPAS